MCRRGPLTCADDGQSDAVTDSGRRREEYAAIAQDLTEAGYSDADASRAVIVLVAARTQIGCLINSEWRKHPI